MMLFIFFSPCVERRSPAVSAPTPSHEKSPCRNELGLARTEYWQKMQFTVPSRRSRPRLRGDTMNEPTSRQAGLFDSFLTPEAMLTPGVAGAMTMMITNALWQNFALPPAYTGLALS